MGRYTMPLPYGWFAVCYSDELNAGDVKPLRYFAKDLVVFRGESGAVHVLDAFCPHLGAHLGHGGEVHGDTIACPFHGWRFDGDACIVDVPYASKMPPRAQQQTGIGSYPVREANGMIWVWHDAENKAPQFEVEVLEEAESDEWQQVRFDWKIGSTIQEMGENAVDGPHFQYVHGSVVPPEFTAEINDHLRKSTIISKMPVLDDEGNKDVQSGQVEESVTESWSNGAGQAWQRFARLPYSILMGSVTAIDHDNVHLRFTFVQKKQLDEMQQLFVDGATQVFKEQVEQDIPIWENKVYHEDPILCDGDGPIHKYRRWFSQFYQGQQ